MNIGPRWIDSLADLSALASKLTGVTRLALDLEGDGYHRYPEHVALVQLALPDGSVYLIDPWATGNLEPLAPILTTPQITKVMHGADFDLRSLDRDFGVHIRGLADTAIAAQFCGATRTGLGTVVAEFLGRRLDKPTEVQRLDWSQRPLPEEALAYAANDVAHLLALHDELTRRLERLGRLDWVQEEWERLEQVRYCPPEPPETAFLRIKGAWQLSGQQLAALREMCIYREGVARQLGRPPSRLIPDRVLIALAQNRGAGPKGELAAPPDLWPGLLAARDRGLRAPPVRLPPRGGPSPWTPEAMHRLAILKRWRRGEAERLGLSSGLVWPLAHLERMALFPARPPEELDDPSAPLVRRWQWRELGASLRVVWRNLNRRESENDS